MQMPIEKGIWCQRRQTLLVAHPVLQDSMQTLHEGQCFFPHSYHPFFPLPTSHFSWSLCSTNEPRKSPPKQISLLLRAHLYCILHQTVNIALQYLLTKLQQIAVLCCHFSPSSYSNRCFLLECSYTILGRPYWYTYEWVIEYVYTYFTGLLTCHIYKLFFTYFCPSFKLIPVQLSRVFIPSLVHSSQAFLLSPISACPIVLPPLLPFSLTVPQRGLPLRSNWST